MALVDVSADADVNVGGSTESAESANFAEAEMGKDSDMANFTRVFKGIHCNKEMDWDQGSNSDEYYLITTVWADLGGSKVSHMTTKVPGGGTACDDVDDGETRKAEVALYSGPARKVVVGTQLFEADFGYADATTKEISEWAERVKDLAESSDLTLPEAVSEGAPEIVNFIFDFDDDMVDHYQLACSWRTGSRSWQQHPQAGARHSLPVFRAWHAGQGANVVAYYDIIVE